MSHVHIQFEKYKESTACFDVKKFQMFNLIKLKNT